jgi:SAM-dependent methyltransferase/uncharacterized protein YkwD
VDVFGAALEARAFLCDAALAAGHELGVFEVLARSGPTSLDQLAGQIGVIAGHRLRALLHVLAALGAIVCDRTAGSLPRFAVAAVVPAHPVVARAGWGLLADVIRHDRPLSIERGEAERQLHHHLASAGAQAARELTESLLGTTSLLDLGAGAGAYSKAFLTAHPAGRATLVDRREVLDLAAGWLGPLADRARFVEGDASTVDAGDDHGAVLLANLLHLHSPAMCARLCAAAARAVAPGGVVAIKDLRVDDDRSGPLEGLLFALNMAIYTDEGDVYSTSQLRAWLADAGLVDIAEQRLAAAPDAIVVIARRPYDSAEATASQAICAGAGGAAESSVSGAGNASAEPGRGAGTEGIAAELDAALVRTADQAWHELATRRALHGDAAAGPAALAFPSVLRGFLAAAVALACGGDLRGIFQCRARRCRSRRLHAVTADRAVRTLQGTQWCSGHCEPAVQRSPAMRSVVLAVVLVGGCVAPVAVRAPSEPPPIVEPLAPPVVFSVADSPATYGAATEPAPSPLAEAVVAAMRTAAGSRGEITRDGRLDQVCAELAPVIAQHITPSDALIELALHAHGIVESSGRVLVARGRAPQELIVGELRAQLGDDLRGRMRVGLATGDLDLVIAIVVPESGVVLEVPRAVPAQASFVIEGRLRPHLREPWVKIIYDDGSTEYRVAVLQSDGKFTSAFSCDAHIGRQWIEIAAMAYQGVISLAAVPVWCGAPAPSQFRAEPAANVAELAKPTDIERRLIALINRERLAENRSALRTDAVVAAQARGYAERLHAPTPDRRDARERLRAAGVEPPAIFEVTLVVDDVFHAAEALINEPVHRSMLEQPELTHVGIGAVIGEAPGARSRLTVTITYVRFPPLIDPERVRQRVIAALQEHLELVVDPELAQFAQRFAGSLAAGLRRDDVWPEIKSDIDHHAQQLQRYMKVYDTVATLVDTDQIDGAALLHDRVGEGVGVGVAQAPRYGPRCGVTWVVVFLGKKQYRLPGTR